MKPKTLLGPIRRLQIQRETLIVGTKPNRTYRTEALVAPDSLVLSPDGLLCNMDGGWVVDRHHTAHPANSRPNLDRMLSIGFTSHYDAMANHFGEAVIGVAGENIIVETDQMITEKGLSGGVFIERPDRMIELKGAAVASPCVPFTRFMMGEPQAALDLVKPHRDFLRDGMRGYVMGLASLTETVAIDVGDLVYLGAS